MNYFENVLKRYITKRAFFEPSKYYNNKSHEIQINQFQQDSEIKSNNNENEQEFFHSDESHHEFTKSLQENIQDELLNIDLNQVDFSILNSSITDEDRSNSILYFY